MRFIPATGPVSARPVSPLPVRLIRIGATGHTRTQALYHAVAEAMTEDTPDTVILARPETPYLCLGWHDRYDAVLDRAACVRAGLPVLRRRVGGGTTYLDGEQPFYQFVFHQRRIPALASALYAYLLAAPVQALERLGLEAKLRAVNEIELGGRRIAGVGGGRLGEAAVVVGNLLCDFDFAVLPRVWKAPWPAFRELATQALRERLTTLREVAGGIAPEAVTEALVAVLPEALGRPVVSGSLTPDEQERTLRLERQLSDPAWLDLHGEGPVPATRRLKIAAGVYIHAESVTAGQVKMDVTLRERDGRIESARVRAPRPYDSDTLSRALIGASVADWKAKLGVRDGPMASRIPLA